MRIILVVLCFIPFLVTAQINKPSAVKAEFVRRLKSSDIQFDQYYGLVDGIHKVQLFIGSTDDEYIAKSIYDDKEYVHYSLEEKTGDVYTLQEIDRDGVFHGEFVLAKNGDDLEGAWNNELHIPIYNIIFYRNVEETNCGDFYYEKVLDGGIYFEDEVKITRNNDDITFSIGNKEYGIECVDNMCTSFVVKGLSIPVAPRLRISIVGDKTYIDAPLKLELRKIRDYKMECTDETSEGKKYSYEMLVTSNKNFNKYLKEKNIESSKIIKTRMNKNLDIRYESVLKCWNEVTYYDDQFISGVTYIQNNESSAIRILPFVYDLKKNTEIDKIFSKKVDEITGDETLKYTVLTPEGVKFLSDFDPIYGQKERVIPFKALKSHFKYSKLKKLK